MKSVAEHKFKKIMCKYKINGKPKNEALGEWLGYDDKEYLVQIEFSQIKIIILFHEIRLKD